MLGVRFATTGLVLGLVACSAGDQVTVPTTPTPTTSTPTVASETPRTSSSAPSVEPSTSSSTLRSAKDVEALWAAYPWAPDDGLACPPPASSPGTSMDPAGPGVVVVVGDSLIRDSRDAIANELAGVGYDVVFVCWGGKNLLWGLEQVDALESLDLMPACLVVNLGTNDLKGTTAQGLSDAVPLQTVAARITALLNEIASVPDVFVVDVAADLNAAPGTMSEVAQAPSVWQAAVDATGVGAAVPWAAAAASGGLIGADGIHDTVQGQFVRGSLIADYVARDCA